MKDAVLTLLLLVLSATVAGAADIRILPAEFVLHGIEGRQQLSVVTIRDGRISASVSGDSVTLESSDPSVVKIERHMAVAVGDGAAKIVAVLGDGSTATSSVRVESAGPAAESIGDAEQAHRWSFRNDVQSIFSRIGCNAGACHGALAGKGGFRLSLRGYDALADYHTVTREARGRRIEIGNPGQSLVLAKPSGAVRHKGGLKLDPKSRDYRILAEWIAAGAAGPNEDDAKLHHICVLPESSLLLPGEQSRILVQAHFDQGDSSGHGRRRVVDVTHWARFTATDQSVVDVDQDGSVSVRGSGEGAVLVWFGSKVALARMTVPYPNRVPPDAFSSAPRRNFIDELNLAQLQTLQLRPSPRCDDQAFLRRATLDTIGRLPAAHEREEYFSQLPSERRDRLIERLLASEDFVYYWTYRWCDMLSINGTRLRPVAVKSYYQWVHNGVSENRPWDQMVREIILARGESNANGATNFYALNQSPEEMTENACQAFLGLSIGCAKCHNHPLEKWTNDQYYAMANLFARVRAKGWGGDLRTGDGLRTLYVASSGELIQPNKGKPQPPAPLDVEPLSFDDPNDRREALADWMTDPSNPYFSRAITNRVWANYFGRGLVDEVDDLRLSNPASNEPLLAATAEHLVETRFNLKQLMRTILQSETYQRSSVPLAENRGENKYLSRYYPRRMMAEVLLDAIDQVLKTTTKFSHIGFPGGDTQETDFYERGTRAIELYDSAVSSYFLKTFGRNSREITCECQRSDEPSMVQVLHLSNGETLNPKLYDAGNCIAQAIAGEASDAEIIKALFVAALTREPMEKELAAILSVVAEYGEERSTALADAAWGILTSPEFTFNH
ncbi:MAG: DUF1549 and DUF1553 domain-containing protein [Pirellulales bacterium]|nr:DUF1549 and DUF1553 domain-containing protein [Pirellulales bacterium]